MIAIILDTNIVTESHRGRKRLEKISKCVVSLLMSLFELSKSDKIVLVVCYSKTKRELRRESISLFEKRIRSRLCEELGGIRGLRLKSLSKIVSRNVYEDIRRVILSDRSMLRTLRDIVKGAKNVDLAESNIIKEVDEDIHLFLKALYMYRGARLVKIVTGDCKARDNLLSLMNGLRDRCGEDFKIDVFYVNIQ